MRPRQDRTTPEDRSVRNAPLVALSILQPKASEGALCVCSVPRCILNILIQILDLPPVSQTALLHLKKT